MKPTLTAAVIGLGVGESHARAYALDTNTHLKWLVDTNRARAKSLAAELGAEVGDEAEVLSDPAIDILSIASYDDMHAPQVVAALRAGKHVFVEKPLCRTRSELKEIKAAWLDGGEKGLDSNLILRAAPIYIWLREAIRTGQLGEIYAFDGDYLYGRKHKITDGWRSEVRHYSVMSGGGIHLIDMMMFLLDQRPDTVTVCGSRIATRGTAFQFDDFQAATFNFSSGVTGRITANFGCAHHHQHIVRIFGTEGTFILDDQGARLLTMRDPEFEAKGLRDTPEKAAKMLDCPVLPADKGDLIPRFLMAILKNEDFTERAQRNFDVISAVVASDRALETNTPTRIKYA